MTESAPGALDRRAWKGLASESIAEADAACRTDAADFVWLKEDSSRVSALDIRIDSSIRVALSRHFPDVAVLSEELGLLAPTGPRSPMLAIVDPVDGTDSLLSRRSSWWVSIGLLDGVAPLAGLIYQPTTRRAHDSTAPAKLGCEQLIIGMSPDQLQSPDATRVRTRLEAAGARLVSTPHAVEKVASVLEGRCAATAYLPSRKSPTWHAWDLAACLAIAAANDILLKHPNGEPVHIDPQQPQRSDPWICASDDATFEVVAHSIK